MKNKNDQLVFNKIIEPIVSSIEEMQNALPDDINNYKLSFANFTINLLFGAISRIESISKLIVEIKTSDAAREIGLVAASKSMYSEAFSRYCPEMYRPIFISLIMSGRFFAIPEIEHLGKILLIDGSLFPVFSTMTWAKYKKSLNGIKLHLSFELNRMIPVEFLSTEGNYSERNFVKKILEEGITYVCDRGYISFSLFKDICDKSAFFIIRGKQNMSFTVMEILKVDVPVQFYNFFENITDSLVTFSNDQHGKTYRIVKFFAMGEEYLLISNRFDLSTYQIIILYAYRWQIELFFRFLKRTFKGVHLWCRDEKGIQIQFYLYMIAYLLLLMFKQELETTYGNNPADHPFENKKQKEGLPCNDEKKAYDYDLVSLLGENLKKMWRIGIHWLIAVKNKLHHIFDASTAKLLAEH